MAQQETFTDRLVAGIRHKKSLLCVGLDPQLRFLPAHLLEKIPEAGLETVLLMFLRSVVTAVVPYAIAVKPQLAFYEEFGSEGIRAYEQIVAFARELGLVVIADAKRGDGGDTAQAYAETYIGEVEAYDTLTRTLVRRPSPMRVDALTVHGYIGEACIQPFVEQIKLHGTGAFVVDKTSFKPNSKIEQMISEHGRPIWQELAYLVQQLGEGTEGREGYRNLGVVAGATYPEDGADMRKILPNAWFLVPGYGAQGGGADGAVIGVNRDGLGCVVNSSRGVLYAFNDAKSPFQCEPENFALAAARAAQASRDDLNAALKRAKKG